MKLLDKTITDGKLNLMENHSDAAEAYVKDAIFQLNASYHSLWNNTEDVITEILQKLLDSGKLAQVFLDHYNTAVALNSIAAVIGAEERAIDVKGRDFTIVNGVVALLPIPEL